MTTKKTIALFITSCLLLAGCANFQDDSGNSALNDNKSSDIIKGLSNGLKDNNVQVKLNSKVTNILSKNESIPPSTKVGSTTNILA